MAIYLNYEALNKLWRGEKGQLEALVADWVIFSARASRRNFQARARVVRARKRSELRVFVAHSRMQEDHARSLQQALNGRDFPSVLDVIDMSEGRPYSAVCAEIDQGFERATHFIVLVTSDYLSKSSRYCRYEISKLINFNKSQARNVLLLKDGSCDNSDFGELSRAGFVVKELGCCDFGSGSPEVFNSAVKVVVDFLDNPDGPILF